VPVADAEAVPVEPASSAANAVVALRAIRIARAVFFIINPCVSGIKTSMFGSIKNAPNYILDKKALACK
jgi:hypothetical protein